MRFNSGSFPIFSLAAILGFRRMLLTGCAAVLGACGGGVGGDEAATGPSDPAVAANWTPKLSAGMVLDPLAASPAAIHSEYPSIHLDATGKTHMLYAEFGADRVWTLKDAILVDPGSGVLKMQTTGALQWTSQPLHRGNTAWPHVTNHQGVYYLVYSAASEPGVAYNGLYLARSNDGIRWTETERIWSGIALDPLLMPPEPGETMFKIYFTSRVEGDDRLLSITGQPGQSWGEPAVQVTERAEGTTGMYTLAGTRLDGKLMLLLEQGGSGWNRLELFCRIDDAWAIVTDAPVAVGVPAPARDAIRYGYWLPAVTSSGQGFSALYNGVKSFGVESGGSILAADMRLSVPAAKLSRCE